MNTDRRSILAGLAIVAVGTSAMGQTKAAMGVATPQMPPKDFSGVKTAADYYANVLGPAETSLSTSQIAVDMATTREVLEFSGFELGEAITVNMVLKGLGASSPAMSDDAKALIEKMKTGGRTEGFDRAYIGFQLANHEFLRDLADAYLHNSVGSSEPSEIQGRSLASLMLAVFKEHTAICKRISTELRA